MSVENMPIFGSGFAPADTDRDVSANASSRSATSLNELRRQVMAFELVILLVAAGVSALVVNQSAPETHPLIVAFVFTAVWASALAASSSFRLPGIESVVGIKRILKGTAIALAVVAVASFVFGALPFRSQVLWELAIGLPLILLARYASIVRLRKLREQGEARVGVLLVSPSRARGQLTREVIDDGRFELVGAVDPDNVDASATPALISSQAISEGADAVMISCSTAMTPKQIRQLAWELESHDIRLLISSRVTGFANNRAHLERVADEVVIEVDNSHQALGPHLVKRAFDIVVSAGLLLLFAPLILILAILIPLESRGSAFFVQPRVGENGKLFPFFKLRSMRKDAHLERADVLGPTDDGILDRYRNDVRITRIGSFIRRWSIDELPQLMNVLLGHMSLIGPRPVLEEELHDLPVHGERVHLAKPGLTGLWQVSGRKEIHWEDRIDLDLEYVDTWSLGLDAKIAAKTVGAVLKGSGAY